MKSGAFAPPVGEQLFYEPLNPAILGSLATRRSCRRRDTSNNEPTFWWPHPTPSSRHYMWGKSPCKKALSTETSSPQTLQQPPLEI